MRGLQSNNREIQGSEKSNECSQMKRFPAEPSDPFGVSCQSPPYLRSRHWIPQTYLEKEKNRKV